MIGRNRFGKFAFIDKGGPHGQILAVLQPLHLLRDLTDDSVANFSSPLDLHYHQHTLCLKEEVDLASLVL